MREQFFPLICKPVCMIVIVKKIFLTKKHFMQMIKEKNLFGKIINVTTVLSSDQ